MTASTQRLISLLLAQELQSNAALPEALPTEAVRRIYGRVGLHAAFAGMDPQATLEMLDRYGLSAEVLRRAIQPAPVLAILDAVDAEELTRGLEGPAPSPRTSA